MLTINIREREIVDETLSALSWAIPFVIFAGCLACFLLYGIGFTDYAGDPPHEITHLPQPSFLYIGIPLVTIGSIWLTGFIHIVYPFKFMPFRKKGKVWEKCPYIIWILKGCCDSIACVFLVLIYPFCIVGFFPIKWVGCIILVPIRIIKTIVIICSVPDGLAEKRIKDIWGF